MSSIWGGGDPYGNSPGSFWSSDSSSYATPIRTTPDPTRTPKSPLDGGLSLRLTGNGSSGTGPSGMSPSIPEGHQLPSGNPVTYAPSNVDGLGTGPPLEGNGLAFPGNNRDSGSLLGPLGSTPLQQQPLLLRLSFSGDGSSNVEFPAQPATSGLAGGVDNRSGGCQRFGAQNDFHAAGNVGQGPSSSGLQNNLGTPQTARSQSFGGFRDSATSPIVHSPSGFAHEGSEFDTVPLSTHKQLQRENEALKEDLKQVVESGRMRIGELNNNFMLSNRSIKSLKANVLRKNSY